MGRREGRRNELERKSVTLCEVWGLLHGILAPEVVREEAAGCFINKRMKDAHAPTHTDTHIHIHPYTHIHAHSWMHTVAAISTHP